MTYGGKTKIDELSTEFQIIEVIFWSLRLTESTTKLFFLPLRQVFPRKWKLIRDIEDFNLSRFES